MIILISLFIHNSVRARKTKKASKSALKQIRSLINSRIEKELPQSDTGFNESSRFVRNPDSKPYKDELSINNADDFFQGDMELSSKQARILIDQLSASRNSSKTRSKRKVGKEPLYSRWNTAGPISYEFDQTIPESTRQRIREALKIYERFTCIRFQEDGQNENRIEVYLSVF